MEYVLKYVKDKRWWIDYVAPFMNGDPLLEPRLPVIAKMIKKYLNAKVNVFTNAALYENRHLLRDRNIDIVHCTVSAATRETYRQVHGRDCFNDAVKTVRWLSKKKRLNQYIIMVYVLNSRNFHELEQWKSLFRGFKQIVRPLFDAGDVKPQSKQAEGNRAFEEYLAKASQTVFPSNLQYSNRPCPCWESLNISYKGELMQCMDLPYELNGGSVFDVDIEEFWLDRNRRGLDCDGCRECKMKNPNWRNLFRRCFNIQ
jgi:MoaA/NifB/PqqE/SkfB family radical SAM enzyme